MKATAANLVIWMEAVAEVANISKSGMKEAAEEAEVKAASAKATTFLLFLAGVCTYRCAIF